MGRMEEGKKEKEKGVKLLLVKTLRKCYSLGARSPKGDNSHNQLPPLGCFSVYVGPEKERFIISTAHINHPLFRTLLDEAESAYGYAAKGPLVLPCDVESFLDTLWEMEKETAVERSPMCGLPSKGRIRTYQLLSPATPDIRSWSQFAMKTRSKSFDSPFHH
ncbi:SAUR-like auxin-responsive protein family [Rhynchospora pubera]|uniref:SAUR-like auxin-responsive protein family n=1 Tax=Rhynchospora pubera TaxID=906938 RepID=A0AAV8BZ42_9POAL|nr:SAUR-like auxin-responsive protein family [Rhynchospora pubera]